MAISISNMIEATDSVYSAFLNLKTLLEDTNKKVLDQKYEEAAKVMVGKVPSLANQTEEDQIKNIAQLYEAVNTTLKEGDYQDVNTLLNKTEDVISFVNSVISEGIDNIDIILSKYFSLYQTGESFVIQNGLQGGTTIPLNNRKRISYEDMKSSGYDNGGGYSTVFSSGYSNEDGSYNILVTPILPDGNVLTADTLDQYANSILNGESQGSKVVLQRYYGKGGQAVSDADAERLHETQEATDKVSDSMRDLASMILEVLESLGMVKSTTKTTKTKNDDIYPLWQRVLNSSLGVDLSLFKNGLVTNGRQAVNIFDQNSQKTIISQTLRSLLNKNTLADIQNSGLIKYGATTSTLNNSGNTKTLDMQATVKSMQDYVYSLSASSEESQAYTDSVRQEIEALLDFQANALTATEEAANITTEEYKELIGDTYNTLEALGMNAFDLGLVETVDGVTKFRENSVAAAQELIKQKSAIVAFGEAITDTKGSIETLRKEIDQNFTQIAVNRGEYSGTVIGSLSRASQVEILNKIKAETDKIMEKPELKNIGLTEDILTKSILSGGNVNDLVSILNIDTSDKEIKGIEQSILDAARKEAIDSIIRIQNENQKNGTLSSTSSWKGLVTDEEKLIEATRLLDENKADSIAIRNYKDLLSQDENLKNTANNTDEILTLLQNYFDINNELVKTQEEKERSDIEAENSKRISSYFDQFNTERNLNIPSYDNFENYISSLKEIFTGTYTYKGNTISQQNTIESFGYDKNTQWSEFTKDLGNQNIDDIKNTVKDFVSELGDEKLTDLFDKLSSDSIEDFAIRFSQVVDSATKLKDTSSELGDTFKIHSRIIF